MTRPDDIESTLEWIEKEHGDDLEGYCGDHSCPEVKKWLEYIVYLEAKIANG